jgi:hypothetical protein
MTNRGMQERRKKPTIKYKDRSKQTISVRQREREIRIEEAKM